MTTKPTTGFARRPRALLALVVASLLTTLLGVSLPASAPPAAAQTPGAGIFDVTVMDTYNRASGDGWQLVSFTRGPCPTIENPDGDPTWGNVHDWFGPAISPWRDQTIGGAQDSSIGCETTWPGYDAAPVRWVIRKTFCAPADGYTTVNVDRFRGDGGARVRVNGTDAGVYGQFNQFAVNGTVQVAVSAGCGNFVDVEVRDTNGAGMVQGIIDMHMYRQFAASKVVNRTNAVPGETATWTIRVTNTGTIDYTAASPARFTDSLANIMDDATFNGVNANVGTASLSGTTLSWSGPLAVGQTATITYSATVRDPAGNYRMDNLLDTPPEGSCDENPAPCNPPPVLIPNLRASKVADTDEVVPGDVVTYTLTLRNIGPGAYTAADPARFTDDLSDVLDDAVYNNDVVASNGSAVTYAAPVLSWSGPLASGATVTFTYSVTIKDLMPDEEPPHNYIMENTLVTNHGNCRAGSTDPLCLVILPVPQLHSEKTADFSNAVPGGTATYTIEMTNVGEGDFTATKPASVEDDLTDVLDDATYNGDAVASDGLPVTFEPPNLLWSGPLAKGETKTITYSVTIDRPLSDGNGNLRLFNKITTPFGNCREPLPPEEEAPAPAGARAVAQVAPTEPTDPTEGLDPLCFTRELLPDQKTVKTGDFIKTIPGGTATYEVTLTNIGPGDFTAEKPAMFRDNLAGVLDDATFNNDIVASNGEAVTYEAPVVSWSGPLASGESVTFTYSVTIDKVLGRGDKILKNVVTDPYDCVEGSTDPDCMKEHPLPELELEKTVDVPNAKPGDVVTYTVTARNIGPGDFTLETPASFRDDLSDVLDDATYNGDGWFSDGSRVIFDGPELVWSNALVSGATMTAQYSFTVNDPMTGNGLMLNHITSNTGNCAEGSTDPACDTATPIAAPITPDPIPVIG